jgi:hypothetical protein
VTAAFNALIKAAVAENVKGKRAREKGERPQK